MEGKLYDYKRDLIGNSDSDKKEFLSDVSSFANASGGHLIIGVEEEKGVPTRILGLDIADIDAEKNRLDNILLAGLKPRMVPVHQIHSVKLAETQRFVIVIRISKSLTMPHMVTFKDTNKFYSRNSHGKYLLDVGEIRNLFVMSETAFERIRNFRMERIAKIIAGETPIKLLDVPKIVLHVIPLSMSDSTAFFDIMQVANDDLWPMGVHGMSRRINFDGVMGYSQTLEEGAYGYVQLFRNGCIECIDANILRVRWKDEGKIIPSVKYESELVDATRRCLRLLSSIKAEPPFFIMVSLLGIKGYRMGVNKSKYWDTIPVKDGIDRDNLIVSEVVVESFEIEYPKLMRPIFDSIWNSAGWRGSENYDDDGNWVIK